jgi:hypothetical protein
MPADTQPHLRVVCICGQRMKISEDMFGLPGKCVACRQKITIPHRDDIPEGTDEFHLDDHPEYLRGPRIGDQYRDEERAAQAELDRVRTPTAESEEEQTPITELDLPEADAEEPIAAAPPKKPAKRPRLFQPRDEREEKVEAAPLDALEPLRIILSLRLKVLDQRRQLDEIESRDRNLVAELDGHLNRIHRVREELGEKLRQLLMETAIELAGTQEKLTQAQVDARVSGIPIDEYQETTHRLRSRRDRLEHRQINLRAWLATRDPFLAGGYLDLTIDALPEDGFAIPIPGESDEDGALLNRHTEGLRAAMTLRATAERKINEARAVRNAARGKEREAANRAVADAKALRRRAQTQIAFYQSRLQQLERDFQSDLDAISAQLDTARDRLRINEIERSDFDRIEAELLAAKTDVTKARALTRRALVANSSIDVPQPKGTFLDRLGLRSANPEPAMPVEWGLACAGGLLILLCLVLRTVGRYSLLGAMSEYPDEAGALFLLPLVLAGLAVGALYLPQRLHRGVAWTALATAGGVIGILLVYRGLAVTSPLAAAFRSGGAGWVQPGLIAPALGVLALLGAAGLSLRAMPQVRYWPAGAFGALCVGLIVALGAAATSATAEPVLHGVRLGALLDDRGVVAADITIANDGQGTLSVTAQPSNSRNAYQLTLERRVENGWEPVAAPALGTGQPGVLFAIPGGSQQTIQVTLDPGQYRVRLASAVENVSLTAPFSVRDPSAGESEAIIAMQPPPPPRTSTVEPTEDTPTTDEETEAEPADEFSEQPFDAPPMIAPEEDVPYVELKGILTSLEGDPRFSLVVHVPGREDQRVMLGIGEPVYGAWSIREFNTQNRSVTLADGTRLLTVRRGERENFPQD